MMKDALFGGVNAAVLTPMRADMSVDLDRMAQHSKWLLANGCNNLGKVKDIRRETGRPESQ